jgi:hypothetical protein
LTEQTPIGERFGEVRNRLKFEHASLFDLVIADAESADAQRHVVAPPQAADYLSLLLAKIGDHAQRPASFG